MSIEQITFDTLGPLSQTTNGNKYILIVMDCFTNLPEAYSIPDHETTKIAEVLMQ